MPTQPPRQLNVLVVEDHQDSGDMVCSLMEAWGHNAALALDGIEALEHIARGPRPDLLLVDYAMPRMNGGQLVAELAKGKHADLPVVIMSASDDPSIAGVLGFLQKPLVFEALEAVTNALSSGGVAKLRAVLGRLRRSCRKCHAREGEWCRQPDRRPAAALCEVRS